MSRGAGPLRDEARCAEFRARLPALMRDFYDRLFDDVMVGFFFLGKDKERLIRQQMAFTSHMLGGPTPYTGPSIQKAHAALRIFEGQFDRRHTILKETLADHAIDPLVAEAWLALDRRFQEKVLASEPCHD